MIDPLRPYWPTNRSIAGLLVRGLCLLCAAGAVSLEVSRTFAFVVVLAAAIVQASVLVFEWMELKRTQSSGVVVGTVIAFLFVGLVLALVVESRSVLVLSIR